MLQEALMGQHAGDCFEEFVRGRSAYLFKLALLLTGQNRVEAEDLLQISLERAYLIPPRHGRLALWP